LKTDYYLKDSLLKDKNLSLVFFKGFYYKWMPHVNEGSLRLTLYNLKVDFPSDLKLIDGTKFELAIHSHSNFDELILTNPDKQSFIIECERIEKEEFQDSKQDLLHFIQDLERQLDSTHGDLFKKNKLIHDLLFFCQRQLDNTEIVNKKANWLTSKKKIEENISGNVYRKILNLLQDK
jgi:hypothetical protein